MKTGPMPTVVMTKQNVTDIVNFLDMLLLYASDLPKQVETFKRRKKPAKAT